MGTKTKYATNIFVYLVLIYAAHSLLAWKTPFVTEKWDSVLWAVDLAAGAHAAMYVVLCIKESASLKAALEAATNIAVFVFAYAAYFTYPFDFSEMPIADPVVRFSLIAAMVTSILMFMINAVKALPGKKK